MHGRLTCLLAYKVKKVCASYAGIGQVVLLADCEDLFQCSVELVFPLIFTCKVAEQAVSPHLLGMACMCDVVPAAVLHLHSMSKYRKLLSSHAGLLMYTARSFCKHESWCLVVCDITT